MSVLRAGMGLRTAVWASLVVGLMTLVAVPRAFCQAVTGTAVVQAVGGISIDTNGMLKNADQDAQGRLRGFWEKALERIPADLAHAVPLRKVSLKALDEAVARQLATGKPLPDVMQHLAGLQQIEYVFVYPEQNDIVLVGPGEGWKVDAARRGGGH